MSARHHGAFRRTRSRQRLHVDGPRVYCAEPGKLRRSVQSSQSLCYGAERVKEHELLQQLANDLDLRVGEQVFEALLILPPQGTMGLDERHS